MSTQKTLILTAAAAISLVMATNTIAANVHGVFTYSGMNYKAAGTSWINDRLRLITVNLTGPNGETIESTFPDWKHKGKTVTSPANGVGPQALPVGATACDAKARDLTGYTVKSITVCPVGPCFGPALVDKPVSALATPTPLTLKSSAYKGDVTVSISFQEACPAGTVTP